ncbi:MAG: glycosyltransferase family 2 protein [Patescibacteria group bacterium]
MENRKIIIVLPAYNAGKTLEKTISSLPKDLEAEIILVDDNSTDDTSKIAESLKIITLKHNKNIGYGGNQKTCYSEALKRGADIVIMLHPDGQYDPRMVKGLLMPLELDICDIALGNRIRSRRETLKNGMPIVKYAFNRILTILQNIILSQNLGEFLTGYRAYTRKVLETLNFEKFSNDFVFDSEFLIAASYHGFRIGDVPVPTVYNNDSSQIKYAKGGKYVAETILTLIKYFFQRIELFKFAIFKRRLD